MSRICCWLGFGKLLPRGLSVTLNGAAETRMRYDRESKEAGRRLESILIENYTRN